jgi:hypothetical protein
LLVFMSGAVTVGTRTGYAAEWLLWCSFICSSFGLGVGADPYMKGVESDRIRAILVCLYIKSQYDIGKRDKLACKGTAAIRHHFALEGLSVDFLGSASAPNHLIKTARKAASSSPDELRLAGQLCRSTVKLPVFSEMMDWLEMVLWEEKGWGWIDIDMKMVFMGIWWAYDICVRVGEFTHAAPKDQDHCIRANELIFMLVSPICFEGRLIESVIGGSHLMALVEFGNLEKCQVKATSHKCGSLVKTKFIGKNTEVEGKSLWRLWQWVRCSGVLPNDELFTRYSYNPKWKGVRYTRKVLCRSTVSAWVKKAAVILGFDPDYFSTHSLRKGGRSDMSAAGMSEEEMNDRGNYKEGSKVGRSVYDYSSQGRGAYSSSESGGARLSARDIRVLIPEA